MKIVVCIKQINHIYVRTGMDPASNFISEEDGVYIVNPFDELAVEQAIRVKEALGEGEVTLLTLGELIAEKALRRCVAMGAERLIQINDPSFGRLDAWGMSFVLARAIKVLEPDMILCGKEALDDQGGQMGAYMAERLGLPYVSCTVQMEVVPGEGKVRIHRSLDRGGGEVLECRLPALFSIEKGSYEPRYPTVRDQLHALDERIECWDREALGLRAEELVSMVEVLETHPPRPRPKRISSPDSSLNGFERTVVLLSGTGAEKVGNIVEGTPEKLVGEIVRFLLENRIIEAGTIPSQRSD